MPSKSNRKRSITQDDVRAVADDAAEAGDTAPVSALVTDTPALPASAPDTAATFGVGAALIAQPGSTAATLAAASGISRSRAAKTLAALEGAGLATRTAGGREGSKRLPDQWWPVLSLGPGASENEGPETAEPATSEDPVPTEEEKPAGEPHHDVRESADAVEDPAAPPAGDSAGTATDTGKGRLGSGQLRDMVLRVLQDHPDQEFSPSALGKLLARSSGAIANACERLMADGAIARTSEKPRRYRISMTAGN